MQRYIGDRNFYRRVFAILMPILIQNVITNFVSMLDNIMVGQIGTEPMSGVAIVNQLVFVFNLCALGGVSGAGILTAQFYGKGDQEGIRQSVRVKLVIGLSILAVFGAVLSLSGETFIGLFLHEGESGLDLEATMRHAQDYLDVMLLQLLPFVITTIYASTLRETGETVLPMKAGLVAVGVNLVFNYILIFGKCGAPARRCGDRAGPGGGDEHHGDLDPLSHGAKPLYRRPVPEPEGTEAGSVAGGPAGASADDQRTALVRRYDDAQPDHVAAGAGGCFSRKHCRNCV